MYLGQSFSDFFSTNSPYSDYIHSRLGLELLENRYHMFEEIYS
jgi:hypothetical protein